MPAPLYRDLTTVEEITALYDIEATVPDFGAYAADFVARSAATRERLGGIIDVRFGPTLAETMDVFPGGDGPRPTVFFVHGGYWKATDSKVWSYVADGLVPHGVTTVVSNYALAPQVTVAEIVRQHRAAFATAWQRADELGIDRDNIVIAGHSAGGHAVAALLATDWAGEYGLPAQPFTGAVPVSPVFDLRPLPHSWLAPYLQLTPADALALSHLAPVSPVPTHVVVGTRETPEFERQSTDWAAAGTAAGLPVEVTLLDHNHFTILDELSDPEGVLTRIALGYLGR
ncbi:alpha/beta hydrolase [Blastococcus sp. SYSU D00820]